MDESQGPDGRRPLASNSAAATRRQAQSDDIAAGTPRLVKNSGSWFVKTYHHTRIGMAKSHNGLPAGTAPTHKAVGRVFFAICDLFLSHRLYAIP